MKDIKVGSKVKFFKKVVETETRIPLGSVGIVCDISSEIFNLNDKHDLSYYVVFPSLNDNDFFNENELEYLGDF